MPPMQFTHSAFRTPIREDDEVSCDSHVSFPEKIESFSTNPFINLIHPEIRHSDGGFNSPLHGASPPRSSAPISLALAQQPGCPFGVATQFLNKVRMSRNNTANSGRSSRSMSPKITPRTRSHNSSPVGPTKDKKIKLSDFDLDTDAPDIVVIRCVKTEEEEAPIKFDLSNLTPADKRKADTHWRRRLIYDLSKPTPPEHGWPDSESEEKVEAKSPKAISHDQLERVVESLESLVKENSDKDSSQTSFFSAQAGIEVEEPPAQIVEERQEEIEEEEAEKPETPSKLEDDEILNPGMERIKKDISKLLRSASDSTGVDLLVSQIETMAMPCKTPPPSLRRASDIDDEVLIEDPFETNAIMSFKPLLGSGFSYVTPPKSGRNSTSSKQTQPESTGFTDDENDLFDSMYHRNKLAFTSNRQAPEETQEYATRSQPAGGSAPRRFTFDNLGPDAYAKPSLSRSKTGSGLGKAQRSARRSASNFFRKVSDSIPKLSIDIPTPLSSYHSPASRQASAEELIEDQILDDFHNVPNKDGSASSSTRSNLSARSLPSEKIASSRSLKNGNFTRETEDSLDKERKEQPVDDPWTAINETEHWVRDRTPEFDTGSSSTRRYEDHEVDLLALEQMMAESKESERRHKKSTAFASIGKFFTRLADGLRAPKTSSK